MKEMISYFHQFFHILGQIHLLGAVMLLMGLLGLLSSLSHCLW